MEFFRIHKDIPFMRHALVFNVISLVTFLLAVFFLATKGLHFSVEFTGGTLMEVSYSEPPALEKLREALATDCTRILIDDFDATVRREAVRIAHGEFGGKIPLEVSGSVDLASLRAIAEDGVDCISIGALTKHVHAIDLSMKLGPPPQGS